MKKLYRSRQDKKLMGLCGGVAQLLNVDPTLVRVLFIVAVIFSSGSLIVIYILAGLVVPKEPPLYSPYSGYNYGNGYGSGYGGYGSTPPPSNGGYYNPPGANQTNWQTPPPQPPRPPQGTPHYTSPPPSRPQDLDAMMEDIEKKALRRELDELKAKLAKLEKEKGDL